MSPMHHDYGRWYEQSLAPFVEGQRRVVLVEVGILCGTGLAVWADLFPEGRIIGLDIDLTHYEANLNDLIMRGAFGAGLPETHVFDGFVDNRQFLADTLDGERIDVFIDDASHTDESILMTFRSAEPHLADNFVYIIEDNRSVHRPLAKEYSQYQIAVHGQLSIVTP